MAIEFQVLGTAGRDNAALVRIDRGQGCSRLLFDCGEGCLSSLSGAEIQSIDHLCFSHLHMDHIGGFDTLFRSNFNRTTRPNVVWGPPETGRILQHRFCGFMWNLANELSGTWYVNDVFPDQIVRHRFEANEAFAIAHPAGTTTRTRPIIETPDYRVEAITLDHLTPSLGYVVRERPRVNVDPAGLQALGLSPGVWLQQFKMRSPDAEPTLLIAGERYDRAFLEARLLIETPGAAVAYLTDFRLDEPTLERLVPMLSGCTTLICESQYREADIDLARRTSHLTARHAAELALRAGVGQLVLFHVSNRYQRAEWLAMLVEAQTVFPNTHFPPHWGMDL